MKQEPIFGYGYLPEVPPSIGIVREIFGWRVGGVSCDEIARRLNGLETGTWNRATNISTILRRGQCKN